MPEVVVTASALEKVTVPPVWSVMLSPVAVVLASVLAAPENVMLPATLSSRTMPLAVPVVWVMLPDRLIGARARRAVLDLHRAYGTGAGDDAAVADRGDAAGAGGAGVAGADLERGAGRAADAAGGGGECAGERRAVGGELNALVGRAGRGERLRA